MTVAVLERRERVGGTWDLFRYPGVRSDSDMYTFGFEFRPWMDVKVLADGTVDPAVHRRHRCGVRDRRQDPLRTKVLTAEWSSPESRWTVTAQHEATGETRTYTCRYLISCTGYYNHDAGYLPTFPGADRFKGTQRSSAVLAGGPGLQRQEGRRHRQRGHRGHPDPGDGRRHRAHHHAAAFAVLCAAAAAKGPDRPRCGRCCPQGWCIGRHRQLNIGQGRFSTRPADASPSSATHHRSASVKILPKDFASPPTSIRPTTRGISGCARCRTPTCSAVIEGKASVVTDEIVRFTKDGILLQSGRELEADIIVTATGLKLQLFGGIQVSVDGESRESARPADVQGASCSADIPNLAGSSATPTRRGR